MRPTPIPDHDALDHGGERKVLGAPNEQMMLEGKCAPLEVMHTIEDGVALYSARIELDPGDLERLQAGERFWITFWGGVTPFAFGWLIEEDQPGA